MKQLAQLFKALGDETRLEVVRMLAGKELCVCDILDAFNISQPAISHHLRVLKQAGLLQDTREGKWVFYRLNPEVFATVEQYLGVINTKQIVRRHCPSSPNRLANRQ